MTRGEVDGHRAPETHGDVEERQQHGSDEDIDRTEGATARHATGRNGSTRHHLCSPPYRELRTIEDSSAGHRSLRRANLVKFPDGGA